MKKITVILILLFGIYLSGYSQQLVDGYILNSENESPLPGVTILNKNNSEYAYSNADGYFRIKASKGDSLECRYIGMQTYTFQVRKYTNNKILLKASLTEIDEVIVIAYGKTKKSQFTGSASSVKKETFKNSSYASLDKLLQAEATGLNAIHQSGDPTEKATVFIRGIGSLSADYDPLYILDGLPVSLNQISSINPRDIESVNVLKDASAISIYGSRGSNGVIIIKSKQATSDKLQIKASTMFSVSETVKDKLNMMNAEEKLRYETQLGLKNLKEEAILERSKNFTNWKDEIFRRGVTKSGSFEIGQRKRNRGYMISLSYYDQKGTVQNSYIKKYTSRINLSQKVSDRIKFVFNTNLAHLKSSQAEGITSRKILKNSPIVQAYLNNPYDAVKDKDGNYLTTTLGPNAIEDLSLIDNVTKQNNLIMHLGTTINLYKGIDFNSKFGVDYQQNILDKYTHPESSIYKGAGVNDHKGDLSRAYRERYNLNQSHTIQALILNKKGHHISSVTGFESTAFKTDDFYVVGKGFASGDLRTLKAASVASSTTGDKAKITGISLFSRINYKFKSNLYIDLSIRRDGSSVFGENKKYANFYSVGAAYNVNSFLKYDKIDYLKIRSSIGTSGNSNIGAYAALPIYSYTDTYNDMSSVSKSQLSNSDLTWEECLSYNVGIDMSAFKSQFGVNIELYRRLTSNLLLNYEISRTNGFTNILKNSGEIRNQGIELSLRYRTKPESAINWSSRFNISYNQNEVTKLPDGRDIHLGFTILREGEAVGSLYSVEYAGVNPANGNPMWYNNNGVPTEEFNAKYSKVQKPGIPPVNGGFFNTVRWKNISFSFDIIFAYGNEIFNNAKYFTNSDGEFAKYNQNRDLLYKQWKKPGDITDVPRQVVGGVNNQFSTKYIEDGSYIKLKNIELMYRLPAKIANSFKCTRAEIFIKANNLVTITSYTGFDPEVATTVDSFRYPSTRSFSLGLNLNF
ncbi:MAG: SusC/RagA family TonB-linked outer membrane protein [Bacteroidales bacterium]|jgi:TonB-linked SusC/RagA family outer membrane protein|nr:SusC/RagA family TonB-linked outer membrane protein [Bacteroidales bacterium]